MFSDITTLYLWAALLLAWLLVLRLRRRPNYPPGPAGLPLLGNLLDMPSDYAWKAYMDIGERYGSDIIHFEVFGTHVVILNSAQAAKDLLEKRSNIYSDRPQSVMANDLAGFDRSWGLYPYGDKWRRHRRLFNQHFRASAVPRFHAQQRRAVHGLLQSLLEAPQEFDEHIHYMAGATVIDVIYGVEAKPGDWKLDLADRGMRAASEVINAGVFLVDLYPPLKHLPSWMPGAGFKRQAAKWKVAVDEMFDVPYEAFKASMRNGAVPFSFLSSIFAGMGQDDDTEKMDRLAVSLAGTIFGAASDTTVATLKLFLLAMTLFPETQRAAHEELDRVLKRKRLPNISDRDMLPQITALLNESLRWNTPVPLGLPHSTISDDEYKGYFIPAGSVVMSNCWGILRNEQVYAQAERFMPERWMAEGGVLRRDVPMPDEAFGFGRRICPGRYFAVDFLWLAIAQIMAVFKIERTLDEQGKEIVPTVELTPRLISIPKPFKCRFTPRYAEAGRMIGSFDEAD
ncbi:cytochrome P450 [Phanerochaete sordida]|uniref:Cytochrome P450 n=1 Tax=Phanerochaete sordida TaxID=48140 RepID=A0A9P3GK89_9APHY|nr:cytochrome P450 [Phanerochaete sordida]